MILFAPASETTPARVRLFRSFWTQSRLLRLLRTTPTDSMEIFLALASLAYGCWFALFSDALTYPAYTRLNFPLFAGGAHLLWGGGLLVLSIAELWAIEADSSRLRKVLPYVMLWLWAWIALLMWRWPKHDPPVVSAAFRALAAAWVICRRRGLSATGNPSPRDAPASVPR